jgi:hypothetical protein
MSGAAIGRAANGGAGEAAIGREEATTQLQRALLISRELAAAAGAGDVELAVTLDAQRLSLLKSIRAALQPMDEPHRSMLREIAELNDRSIGQLEHRFRAKCRDMDMLALGRRAVRAYST